MLPMGQHKITRFLRSINSTKIVNTVNNNANEIINLVLMKLSKTETTFFVLVAKFEVSFSSPSAPRYRGVVGDVERLTALLHCLAGR